MTVDKNNNAIVFVLCLWYNTSNSEMEKIKVWTSSALLYYFVTSKTACKKNKQNWKKNNNLKVLPGSKQGGRGKILIMYIF